jgi:hypothetical protein
LYLPAKVVPLIESLAGVRKVLVWETEISTVDGRGAAHSLQNLAASGFSERHFGHCVGTSSPYLAGKILSRNKGGVNSNKCKATNEKTTLIMNR